MRSEYLSKKTIHCLCSLRSALPVPFDDRIDGGFDALSPIMRAALEKSVRIRDKAPPTCRHLSLNGRNPILVVLLDLLICVSNSEISLVRRPHPCPIPPKETQI